MRRVPLFTCRFRVSGLNLERFLNALAGENVPLLSARRVGARALACECYAADLPRIGELAREKGWKLTDARPARLSAVAARLRARPGLPAGAAVALLLLLALTRFVWRVEITGAGAYRADIAQFLAAEGCGVGAPLSRVDAEALERKLAYRYPDIAWFHVYAYNVTLAVEATRGVPAPEAADGAPGDVVATRDGVVAEVRVFAGTAAVKPGDIVRKGQVLIAGVERGRDDAQIPVSARGEVVARCWRSRSARVSAYEVASEETGREAQTARLRTPWFSLPLSADAPNFLASNAYVARAPVVGCFFPVMLETALWREVAMEYRPRDAAEVRAEATGAAHALLAESLRGYEIIDKWTDYCMIEDGVLSATATAEWRADIGGPAPP